MIDLGRKQEDPGVAVSPQTKKETRVHYPTLSLNDTQIPKEIAEAKPGDSFRCEIVVQIANLGIDTYGDKNVRVELEIKKLGVIGKSGKATREEYLNMSQQDREEYDKRQVEEENA